MSLNLLCQKFSSEEKLRRQVCCPEYDNIIQINIRTYIISLYQYLCKLDKMIRFTKA